MQKQTFHRNSFLKFAGSIFVDFVVFFGGLGATFLIFVALETDLKIDGFSKGNPIQCTAGDGGNQGPIGHP